MLRAFKTARSRIASILVLASLGLSVPLGLLTSSAEADVIASRVTIKFDRQDTKFQGRVTADVAECVVGRLVRVFKVRPGEDKKIGRDLTNANGHWVVDVRHADGEYYAKVSRTVISTYGGQHTCKADRSPTISV